jgi:hypothetical protein
MQAPLGRAVIGGLVMSTVATLLILPPLFALIVGRRVPRSPSIYPDDPESRHYDPDVFAEPSAPAPAAGRDEGAAHDGVDETLAPLGFPPNDPGAAPRDGVPPPPHTRDNGPVPDGGHAPPRPPSSPPLPGGQ